MFLRTPVTDAVITMPAWFNSMQRESLKRACRVSGLNILTTVSEPVAALYAYALGPRMSPLRAEGTGPHHIIALDLGAGSFQVAVGVVDHNVLEIKGTWATVETGGDLFELRILDALLGEFHRDHGIGQPSPSPCPA